MSKPFAGGHLLDHVAAVLDRVTGAPPPVTLPGGALVAEAASSDGDRLLGWPYVARVPGAARRLHP